MWYCSSIIYCNVQSASVHAFHSLLKWYSKIVCVHGAAIVHRVQIPGMWWWIVQVSRMNVQSNHDHCYCIYTPRQCVPPWYTWCGTPVTYVAGINIGWPYIYIICSACVIPLGMCIVICIRLTLLAHMHGQDSGYENIWSLSKYSCGVSLTEKV